jgi:hypothetical protein
VIQIILSLLIGVMLLGCKSRPLGPYTSPRVTGQVLAADKDQPLANVLILRGSGEAGGASPPKGAELLMRKAPAQTDVNGIFELPSERVLSVVRGAGWNVVSLSFVRNGYQHFQTNCPINMVTNMPSGEPVVDVGRIFLQPTLK